jgi:hypothetical protein
MPDAAFFLFLALGPGSARPQAAASRWLRFQGFLSSYNRKFPVFACNIGCNFAYAAETANAASFLPGSAATAAWSANLLLPQRPQEELKIHKNISYFSSSIRKTRWAKLPISAPLRIVSITE